MSEQADRRAAEEAARYLRIVERNTRHTRRIVAALIAEFDAVVIWRGPPVPTPLQCTNQPDNDPTPATRPEHPTLFTEGDTP